MKGVKMLNKYNLDTLNELLNSDPSVEEVTDWFNQMDMDYQALLKKGEINDDIMDKLVDFWLTAGEEYSEYLISALVTRWPEEPPKVIRDIIKYTETFHQRNYEAFLEKMDDVEKEETCSLFDELWNRQRRMEVTVSFYDWDADTFIDEGLTIPRFDRDVIEYDFKLWCAKVIYNRGNMLVKFYSKRGYYGILGVSVNGSGRWYCMDEDELASTYHDAEGEPVVLKKNETLIYIDRDIDEPKGNVVFFKK